MLLLFEDLFPEWHRFRIIIFSSSTFFIFWNILFFNHSFFSILGILFTCQILSMLSLMHPPLAFKLLICHYKKRNYYNDETSNQFPFFLVKKTKTKILRDVFLFQKKRKKGTVYKKKEHKEWRLREKDLKVMKKYLFVACWKKKKTFSAYFQVFLLFKSRKEAIFVSKIWIQSIIYYEKSSFFNVAEKKVSICLATI